MATWEETKRAVAEYNARTNGTAPEPPRSTQTGDSMPGDNEAYVEAGVRMQLDELRQQLQPGRNQCLYISAKALGRIAGVDRTWLREQLISACQYNGLVDDDGIGAVRKTIRSGFRNADAAGPRDIPTGPEYFLSVTEVPMAAFGVTPPAANGAAPKAAPAAPGAPLSASLPTSPLEPVMARIIEAEEDFWDTPELQQIYDAAMTQLVPPWALLSHCAARALTMVPARIRLPGVVGGLQGGSLNWFAAVVAESGQGKSTAQDLADELVPGYTDPMNTVHPIERNVGSGEGLIHAFIKEPAKGGKNPSPTKFHDAVLFYADEIDNVSAMEIRAGSTLLPVLRQAFTGGALGFSYSKNTNNFHLAKHSYRLVFVMSGQPTRCASLLADHHGGTPQRFQWFPAFDLRLTDTVQQFGTIAPLVRPAPGDWASVSTIDTPDEAKQLVRSTRVAVSRGTAGSLNSHEIFVRLKFGAAIAALHGRTDMSYDDWRRSGIGGNVSRITREWVQSRLAGVEEEEDVQKGRRRAVVADASDVERARRLGERRQLLVDQIADWIRGKLAAGPMTQSVLVNKQRSDKRKLTEHVLDELVSEGHVDRKDNAKGITWLRLSKLTKTPGPSGPGPAA